MSQQQQQQDSKSSEEIAEWIRQQKLQAHNQ